METGRMEVSGDELLGLLGSERKSEEFARVEKTLGEKCRISEHHGRRFVSFKKAKVLFGLDPRDVIDTLFFQEDCAICLPKGLCHNHSRSQVRMLLGGPAFSREKQDFVGAMGAGDVFDFPNVTLTVDFSHDESEIVSVCCMTATSAPGRAERHWSRKVARPPSEPR
jgi:hypothetical protein